MAQTIKTWLREQSKNFKSKTIEELSLLSTKNGQG